MIRWAGVMAAVLFCASGAFAQSSIRSLEFDDFGLTQPLTPGARPAGMAGAYTAVVNDANALVYNPAGLSRVKRIEVTLGAGHERDRSEVIFYGNPSTVDSRTGVLDNLAVAFPIPVLRGSMTAAAGVYRMYSTAIDLHYSGFNPMTDTRDNFLLQQTGSIYGYHVGVSADLASVLSGGISAFILDGTVNSLRQYDFTFLQSNPLRSIFVSDDVTMDVDGYGGRIGGVFHFLPGFKGGVSFTTPILVKMRGAALTEVTDVIDNGVDRFLQTFAPVETEYLLPFRVDTGVALDWRWITLAADVGYSDWTTAAVDRRRLRNRQLETLFREVVDVRVGTEVTVPRWPVRVRGGYARIPYPLKFLPTDRIELQEMEKIDTVTERHQWTAGVGGLIGRVLTLDAAYTLTRGERSVENLSQSENTQRFLLSASYRF